MGINDKGSIAGCFHSLEAVNWFLRIGLTLDEGFEKKATSGGMSFS